MIIWISSADPRTRNFLFLDRDGVINHDSNNYIKHWKEFHFYPDALNALKWLRKHTIGVILISNQSALHRGLIDWNSFWDVHYRMIRHIREAGGDILGAFYCPHLPEEGCTCRKPSPGMILAASALYRIPLASTFMIGDKLTDILAASHAGCRAVLLDRARWHRVDTGEEFPAEAEIEHNRFATLMESVSSIFG